MALSGIAAQHADYGYSRRGDFGSSIVHSKLSVYLPDSTNVCGSKSGEFEGIAALAEG